MYISSLSLAALLLAPLSALATPVAYTAEDSQTHFQIELAPPPIDDAARDFPNRVLLIRHGEKPERIDGTIDPGLSKDGKKRAQCLREYMGEDSKYDIGLILVESFNPKSGMRMRPYLTVEPLAVDLGLIVNTDCERDDAVCVHDAIKEFSKKSGKDVLICWKHSELSTIAQELGAKIVKGYPDDRYDVVWHLKNQRIQTKESEQCRGIDDDLPPRHKDRDLDVDFVADDTMVLLFVGFFVFVMITLATVLILRFNRSQDRSIEI